MCISNNAYEQPLIDFNDTIQLGVVLPEAERLCGYFNRVHSKVVGRTTPNRKTGEFGWNIPPSVAQHGNAMLLAIPAVPGTVSEANLIPLKDCPHLFEDVKRSVAPMNASRGPVSFCLGIEKSPQIQVVKGFDGGTYDVVITPSAAAIATVLKKIDKDKRPTPNVELWSQLDIAYPDFTFLFFCFSEADSEQAGGALVRYKTQPHWEHLLHLPALDGHNGRIERGAVELNHTLVVSAPDLDDSNVNARELMLTDTAAEKIKDLPEFVIGKIITKGTVAPQGDFLFSVEDINEGIFRAKRELPPGLKELGRAKEPFFIERTDADDDGGY